MGIHNGNELRAGDYRAARDKPGQLATIFFFFATNLSRDGRPVKLQLRWWVGKAEATGRGSRSRDLPRCLRSNRRGGLSPCSLHNSENR
jgi:hypothetical protein